MRQELSEWIEDLACRAGLDGLPPGARRVAFLAGAILLVIALWWWGVVPGTADGDESEPGAPPVPAGVSREASSPTPTLPSASASVTVHVVGCVRRPGVYVLGAGARASDAVAAAGGLLPEAEQSGVNLARQAVDGEQIVVPKHGEAPVPAAGAPAPGAGTPTQGSGAGAAGPPIDLNSATVEQLDSLPGVGPATAQKIIADREANGPFKSSDDLMRVPGIGAKRFETLKELITAR